MKNRGRKNLKATCEEFVENLPLENLNRMWRLDKRKSKNEIIWIVELFINSYSRRVMWKLLANWNWKLLGVFTT